MMFSVCATFSGIANDPEFQSDMEYDDVVRTCRNLGIEFDETENGDSEYLYLSSENFDVDALRERIAHQVSETHDIPLPEEDDRGYEWAIEFLREHMDNDDMRGLSFWERWALRCRDLTINGVLDREQFTALMEGLGAYATDENTMGTLGGPLSNGMPTIVPDIVFRIESQCLIDSIRVTPFPSWTPSHPETVCTPESWDRLRSAVINCYES